MTATTTARPRKSRAARAAEQSQKDAQQQEDQDQGQPQPEAKPEPIEPFAQVETQGYPRTFYRPIIKVTLPDGDVVETIATCEHETKYGHESERAALACARRIAAQRGLRIGAK